METPSFNSPQQSLPPPPLEAVLMMHLQQHGFLYKELPILHSAEPFFELSGEEIRSHLYLTSDAEGKEFCLRPEFTIPAVEAYLKSAENGQIANQLFMGSIFRQSTSQKGESLQIGIESFGRQDKEAADADIFIETLNCTRMGDKNTPIIVRMGDTNLFNAWLEALSFDETNQRKLSLAISENRITPYLEKALATGVETPSNGLEKYSGILDILKKSAPNEAKAFITDILSMTGFSTNNRGRSIEEIANRFLERSQNQAKPIQKEQADNLKKFLMLEGNPDQLATKIRNLAQEIFLTTPKSVEKALDSFETRTGFIEANGIPIDRLKSATLFARNIGYYSGFVFEISTPSIESPLAAGGRYDHLLEKMGSNIPAIGAAIWVENLTKKSL